jgi:hypothetical protein
MSGYVLWSLAAPVSAILFMTAPEALMLINRNGPTLGAGFVLRTDRLSNDLAASDNHLEIIPLGL